jgi:hypothetical protein
MKNRKGTHAKEENGSSRNSVLYLSGNSCVDASGPAIGWHEDKF